MKLYVIFFTGIYRMNREMPCKSVSHRGHREEKTTEITEKFKKNSVFSVGFSSL
jgi:hypothetical protein